MSSIFSYLSAKEGDKEKYDAIVEKYSLKEKKDILWYHSAGCDFQSLLFAEKGNELNRLTGGKPGLFIYTDMSDHLIEMVKEGKLFESKEHNIKVNSIAEVEFDGSVKDYFAESYRKGTWGYRGDNFPIYLFDINPGNGQSDVPLLYFFWENTTFLKAFVIERETEIKYFQKPREYGFGGGWTGSQVYMLYFTGLMKAEFVFLERATTYMNNLSDVRSIMRTDKVLYNSFMSESNYLPEATITGMALKRFNPQINKTDFYEVYKLVRTKDKIKGMTFDEKMERIMQRFRIS